MREGITEESSSRESMVDFALIMLFLLFIILPVVIIKVPSNPFAQKSNGKAGKPLVFLQETDNKSANAAVKENIETWMRIKNPFRGLSPDCEYSFGYFLDGSRTRNFQKINEEELLKPIATTSASLIPLDAKQLPLKKSTNVQLEPTKAIVVKMEPLTRLKEEPGVFWFDDRGRILQNPPEIDTANAKRAMEAVPKDVIIKNTSLQAIPPAIAGMPPRVVVRSSSGSSALDKMAASALRASLAKRKAAPTPMPIPPDGVMLEVLWKGRRD